MKPKSMIRKLNFLYKGLLLCKENGKNFAKNISEKIDIGRTEQPAKLGIRIKRTA